MMIVRAAIFCIIFFISGQAFASSYDRMIVFGDSLSDIGNNLWVNHYSGPHPQDVMKKKLGAPVTNDEHGQPGKLWVQDFLKDSPLFQGSHRDICASSLRVSSGASVDYAWAGAITKDGFVDDDGYKHSDCSRPGEDCAPGVLMQVKEYLNDTGNRPDQKALYIIWAGGNDLINNAVLWRDIFSHPWRVFKDLGSLSRDPERNIVDAAHQLIQYGAPSDHVFIIDLPDVTKTPAAQVVLKNHPRLEKKARKMVRSFNDELQDRVAAYNKDHGADIHLIDIYPLFQKVIDSPGSYGFDNVTGQCINHPSALAKDCKGYLFYNYKHPTTSAGKVIARYISDQVKG